MIETEIRAIINDPHPLYRELKLRGFTDRGITKQLDMMLDDADASLFRSGRKLRIRIEDDNAILTYKGLFDRHKTLSRREEVNIGISEGSVPDYIALFEALGFPLCFQIPKVRRQFEKDSIGVSFDEWPIIGYLVEIEGAEQNITELADQIAPGVQFGNYRLKELFREAEIRSGKTIAELQETYERMHGVRLGRIDLLMK
jgi:predicted adenylyl cyclase CyaB